MSGYFCFNQFDGSSHYLNFDKFPDTLSPQREVGRKKDSLGKSKDEVSTHFVAVWSHPIDYLCDQ